MPRKQKAIATLDAETDPFKFNREPQPFVWGFYDGETFQYFWGDDPKQIAEDLYHYLEGYDEIIIYVHNGGKFDIFFLLEYLDEELFIVNGRIAKATMYGGKITIKDSYMIIPIPLVQYEKDSIEYWKMEKEHRNNNKNEIIRYLRKDCTALYELCDAFHKRFGNQVSLAGTALKELKKTGYPVIGTRDSYDKIFRPFYYGGRVQCFEVGNLYGDFEYVDINSSYPFAMMHDHWVSSSYYCHVRLPTKENGSWFAEITAQSDGCLPLRDEKLLFPNDDKYRTYFASGWEINAGLETGTLKIKKVHKVYIPDMVRSFSEYVDKFFAEKAAAKEADDKIAYIFAKLLQNSCYGKFGQDGRKFEKFCIVPLGEWPINDPKWEHDYRWNWHSDTDNGMSFFKRKDPSDRFYNVATAASVTAFARAYLFRNLLKAERPIYCDTDSIICHKFNGDIGKKLGQWELEARLSEIHIGGRKTYAGRFFPYGEFGPVDKVKTASKGVKLNFDQIKTGIRDKLIITDERDAPTYSLAQGKKDNKRAGAYFNTRKISFENLEKNLVRNPV